jgi:6-phosphofructokinase 1
MSDSVFFSYSLKDINSNLQMKDLLSQVKKELLKYSIKYFNYNETYFSRTEVSRYLNQSSIALVFVNKVVTDDVLAEITQINNSKDIFSVFIRSRNYEDYYKKNAGSCAVVAALLQKTIGALIIESDSLDINTVKVMKIILNKFNLLLPRLPYFTSYEKDIILLYKRKILDQLTAEDINLFESGVPPEWPDIQINTNYLTKNTENPISKSNYKDIIENRVVSGALTEFFSSDCVNTSTPFCINRNKFSFPEAGLRKGIRNIFDKSCALDTRKKIGIVVSGGIAPGINAVIHAIVQRHWKYYFELNNKKKQLGRFNNLDTYFTSVMGFKNGFAGLKKWIDLGNSGNGAKWENNDHNAWYEYLFDTTDQQVKDQYIAHHNLKTRVMSKHIDEPGSILPTSRAPQFTQDENKSLLIKEIIEGLERDNIRILYIIGGEGSMRFAHQLAIYSMRKQKDVSIVGIPKTMDNDILWVWKPFGFESAVIKASEVINQISWEIKSNPKLAIVQLFGSFSGFVASHAVLGSRAQNCDLVLIPELSFSIKKVCDLILNKLKAHRQSLVVLAECAFPNDLIEYLYQPGIPLSEDEKKSLEIANNLFRTGGINSLRNKFGATKDYDVWSSPLLKLIIHVLEEYAVKPARNQGISIGKTITNKPQHLVRSIPPSPIDIIHAERLGFLAVDSAMAGCTDFMISQWLTEYCLVPLALVTMGSKQIPIQGTFWKSVIAKTGQDKNLD